MNTPNFLSFSHDQTTNILILNYELLSKYGNIHLAH